MELSLYRDTLLVIIEWGAQITPTHLQLSAVTP
jgi:hypothetical protein